MKATLGYVRRADQDFSMIELGDHIAIGVSGGKDSLLLLYALALYRHIKPGFTLRAIMLASGPTPPDTAAIEALCQQLQVPFHVEPTQLYQILLAKSDGRSPCPLCARLRRAMLCDLCVQLGCNKLALGHHREDALETLLMSLIFEARLHTFHPKTCLEDTGVTVIRPLVYMPEKEIIHMVAKLRLPVLTNPCPANGHTRRQEMKNLLGELGRRYPHLQRNMLGALRNREQYGLWDLPADQLHTFDEAGQSFPLAHSSKQSSSPPGNNG